MTDAINKIVCCYSILSLCLIWDSPNYNQQNIKMARVTCGFHHSQPSSVCARRRQMYQDIVARETIPDDIATFTFWRSLQDRLPVLSALAKTYIALPVTSVDVERSFSKYGSALSPLRCSLAPASLKSYCSVFYNNSAL